MANPPRSPQDNGVVERMQGVGKQWCEPWTRGSSVELERRLEVMDRVQRERYPSVRGRSRLEAYPDLKHSGRPYDLDQEETCWDLGKVWNLVRMHRVPRRVNGRGRVSVYNRPYSVGVTWASQIIWVGFDPLEGAWTFQDEKGHEIRRKVATELCREPVRGMDATHRRNGIHAKTPAVERQGEMREYLERHASYGKTSVTD
jgi:hypothetical protein